MNAPKRTRRDTARAVSFRSPLDLLRIDGLLAPHDSDLNMRRWQAGAALLRLHNRGWKDSIDGKPNPLDGSLAADARAMLEEVENLLHPAFWRVIVRVVFEGADVSECRSQVGEVFDEDADVVLMDRLRLGLDLVSPMLGIL